jgi:peptide/nickel transport system substrate-binding protein
VTRPQQGATNRLTRRAFLTGGATGAGLAGLAAMTGIAGHDPLAPLDPVLSPLPAASAAPAGAHPRRGGVLQAAQDVDPISLDPHANANVSALQGYEHAYESLTTYDEQLNVLPALAARWEIAADQRTYTFHLRPGVKFHNGQTLIGDDVKYSIERVLDPRTASPFRNVFAVIDDVTVLDPLTVRVHLTEPYPGLLAEFASLRASAVVPNRIADRVNLKLQAVGTGPFRLTEYVPQDHFTYVRHEDYWARPLPYLDGMAFKILPEEDARIAGVKAGQLHYAGLSAQGARAVRAVPGLRILQSPFAWAAAHRLNVGQKPLDDARVRRAIRLAVDTQEVIQKAVYGAGVPTGPLPTGFGGWALPPAALPYQKPDLEGARKLLAAAGYPNGGFTITVKCSPQYPEFVAFSVVLQAAAQKLGITVDVQQLEWGAYLKATARPFDFQLGATAWTFRSDPDGYLFPFFHSTGVFNAGPYRNPRVDGLLEEARRTPGRAERVRLYREIQHLLLEDAAAFWYYVKINFEALSARVEGYAQSFTGRRMFLRNAWLAA